MHSRMLIAMGFFVASSLAQDYTPTTSSSSAASTTGSGVCGSHKSDCTSSTFAASTIDNTPFVAASNTSTFSNTTSLLSNLSTKMVTLSTSTISYRNSSLTASDTAVAVPTSILVATGTPVIPGSGSTITSYKIVAPTASGTASATPTSQSSGGGKSVGMLNMALVALGIASLFLT